MFIIIIIFWPRYSIPEEWKNYPMQYILLLYYIIIIIISIFNSISNSIFNTPGSIDPWV